MTERDDVELFTGGKPLGWFETMITEEKEIVLSSGDRIILYTDGITESMNPESESFGEQRLQHFIKENNLLDPEPFSEKLILHLFEFTGTYKVDDDLCFFVIDVL